MVQGCPVPCRRFSSIPGLCPLDTLFPRLSQPQVSPDIAKCPAGHRIAPAWKALPYIHRSQMPYLTSSISFHFILRKLLSWEPCSGHQETGRNITQMTLCPCFFLFQSFSFTTESLSYKYPFLPPWGNCGQLVTNIPVINSYCLKSISSLLFIPYFVWLKNATHFHYSS